MHLLAQAAQTQPFLPPSLDYHAVAPEIVLVAGFVALILVDLFTDDLNKRLVSAIGGLAFLGALVPILTLWGSATDRAVTLDGAPIYVVDRYSLILKGLFIASGYVVVLISTHYIGEGDYWEGEYYTLILSSVLGMVVMASARDLVTIFIALELLSIPAYMLAAWRKRDNRSGEAGMKYYLMGVFASAVLLYGMSLLYGAAGSTSLQRIGDAIRTPGEGRELIGLAIVFVLVGFAFKVSAVPFHTWAPDTYEGAPTPVTAFLAVASKTAGFVALMNVVFLCFASQGEVVKWVFFPLAIITMTVGNLIALRQDNIIRMLAYSGVAQAGYMLCPLAVSGNVGNEAMQSLMIYLVIYAAMNLGAFAVVIAVARRTGSGEIDSMAGMFQYAPGLMAAMTIFLAGFAGIPPAGGWFGKFAIFNAVIKDGTFVGYTLAGLIGVNSVIAAFYYGRVVRVMFTMGDDHIDQQPLRIPAALKGAIAITLAITVAVGVYPGLVSKVTDTAVLVAAAATP